MNGHLIAKIIAWGIALTLVALPIVGVLNGWFAADRWPVTKLNVSAEFIHVSAEQVRAAVRPALGKGFFAIQLDQVRDALAKLPWVEQVEARKRWPDTLDLVIREYHPYAHWGEGRLISRRGQVFTVAGANELPGLPRLTGPDDRTDDVLAFYADCAKRFAGSDMEVDAVTLSPRGDWQLELASGTAIEVGSTAAQAHLQRFLDVWPRLSATHAAPPIYVDLRYENGFSMRWPDEPQPAAPATPTAPVASPVAAPRPPAPAGDGAQRPVHARRDTFDPPPRAAYAYGMRAPAPAGSTHFPFLNSDAHFS